MLGVCANSRFRMSGGLAAAALCFGAPALADSDPMLAGAAYARSDLSPLTGLTLLRFVPGHGLERSLLDQPLPDPGPDDAPPVLETAPASATATVDQISGRPHTQALADKPISAAVRDAVNQVLALKTPNSKRFYAFVATGDRLLGFNFGPTVGWGLSPEGLSLERSEVRSTIRTGLGWQDGPYTALISFTRSKPRVLVPWLPAVKNDLIGVTLIHADR